MLMFFANHYAVTEFEGGTDKDKFDSLTIGDMIDVMDSDLELYGSYLPRAKSLKTVRDTLQYICDEMHTRNLPASRICSTVIDITLKNRDRASAARSNYAVKYAVDMCKNVSALFEGDMDDRMDVVLHGGAVAVTSLYDLTETLRCMLPYPFHEDAVTTICSAFGIGNARIDRHAGTFPAAMYGDEPDCFMRNGLHVGGYNIIIEDAAHDCTALYRIRQYIALPSGAAPGTLLIVVINNDGTIADGSNVLTSDQLFIRNTFTKSPIRDNQGIGYVDAFTQAYGPFFESGLPFLMDRTQDICFIQEDEYLYPGGFLHPVFSVSGKVIKRYADRHAADGITLMRYEADRVKHYSRNNWDKWKGTI